MLQSEEDEELPEASNKITCSGRRCSANEHCCSGTVCVDLDGRKFFLLLFKHATFQMQISGYDVVLTMIKDQYCFMKAVRRSERAIHLLVNTLVYLVVWVLL